MILEVIVYASAPTRGTQRAAERVADVVCGERQLVNRGQAVFVRQGSAEVDGRRRVVLVYVVHAHHRDDADGTANDHSSNVIGPRR